MSVGNWIVGVRADTSRTSRSIRRIFGEHLIEPTNQARSNLSIRRDGRWNRSWIVYIGGDVAFRVTTRDRAIKIVRQILGEIALPNMPGRVRLRAFAGGQQVVLLDHQRPALVDDLELRSAGIEELPVWEPVINVDTEVLQQSPMLVGRGVPETPSRYRIAGIVTGGVAADGNADVIGLWRHSTDQSEAAIDLLNALQHRAALNVALDPDEARLQILRLIAG